MDEIEKTVDDATTETASEEDTSQESTEDESVDDIKARLAKAEELANNYKIRAEKAEKKAKEVKPEAKADLSNSDMFALLKANVAEDDIDDVKEYASLKNISVAEALKSSIVKGILKEKEEQRTVAVATNVTTARRTTSKLSDDALLSKAEKGDLPDDLDEIARLNKARWGIK